MPGIAKKYVLHIAASFAPVLLDTFTISVSGWRRLARIRFVRGGVHPACLERRRSARGGRRACLGLSGTHHRSGHLCGEHSAGCVRGGPAGLGRFPMAHRLADLTPVVGAPLLPTDSVMRGSTVRNCGREIVVTRPNVDFLQTLPIFGSMSQLPPLPIARRSIKHVLARAVVTALQ